MTAVSCCRSFLNRKRRDAISAWVNCAVSESWLSRPRPLASGAGSPPGLLRQLRRPAAERSPSHCAATSSASPGARKLPPHRQASLKLAISNFRFRAVADVATPPKARDRGNLLLKKEEAAGGSRPLGGIGGLCEQRLEAISGGSESAPNPKTLCLQRPQRSIGRSVHSVLVRKSQRHAANNFHILGRRLEFVGKARTRPIFCAIGPLTEFSRHHQLWMYYDKRPR